MGVQRYKKSFFIVLCFFWGILGLHQWFRHLAQSNKKFKEKLKMQLLKKQTVVKYILNLKQPISSNLVLHKISYCYCENRGYLISHNNNLQHPSFLQEKLIFQISIKTKLLKKQSVVINILRLEMIKQTKPNNLTLPDLQNMCFWWRYKVLKNWKKSKEPFSREWAIFVGMSPISWDQNGGE